jgi:hypothetical protein
MSKNEVLAPGEYRVLCQAHVKAKKGHVKAKRAMSRQKGPMDVILQVVFLSGPAKISKKVHSNVCLCQSMGTLSAASWVSERNLLVVESFSE